MITWIEYYKSSCIICVDTIFMPKLISVWNGLLNKGWKNAGIEKQQIFGFGSKIGVGWPL